MSNDFEQFCKNNDLDFTVNTPEELAKIAAVFEREISQDLNIDSTDVNQALQEYEEQIRTYVEQFLPIASVDPAVENTAAYEYNTWNALHFAAYHGYDHYLSKMNVPELLNKPDQHGMTPLHLAAAAGQEHTVQQLLANGADVHVSNKQGELPLACAISSVSKHDPAQKTRREAIYRNLLSHDPETLNHCDSRNNTVLHALASFGYDDLLKDAIAQDVDHQLLQIKNNENLAPIHVAILSHQFQTFDVILAAVPDMVNLTGKKFRKPIHLAASLGDLAMLKRCCEENPQAEHINARDSEGKTAWMIASEAEKTDLLELLKNYQADEEIYPTRETKMGF